MKKTALVTGGAKRIGRHISLALADKGYNIALHYNTSKAESKAVQDEIKAKNVDCILLQADLGDDQQVEQIIPKVLKNFEGLDLLVNNASVFERKTFLNTSRNTFDLHFNVNCKAPFFISQAFAQQVSEGHIINILDTKITKMSKYYFSYTLTKKLLYEFTGMAAKALAPCIRVNGICPGLIMPAEKMTDSMIASMIKKTPLKKKGDVEQVISALSFFLENDFITGEVIYVDGGRHLR
ncbi:MAG: SDR family oxidoreductase [bacterium]